MLTYTIKRRAQMLGWGLMYIARDMSDYGYKDKGTARGTGKRKKSTRRKR